MVTEALKNFVKPGFLNSGPDLKSSVDKVRPVPPYFFRAAMHGPCHRDALQAAMVLRLDD